MSLAMPTLAAMAGRGGLRIVPVKFGSVVMVSLPRGEDVRKPFLQWEAWVKSGSVCTERLCASSNPQFGFLLPRRVDPANVVFRARLNETSSSRRVFPVVSDGNSSVTSVALAVAGGAEAKTLGMRFETIGLGDTAVLVAADGERTVVGVHRVPPDLVGALISELTTSANPDRFSIQMISGPVDFGPLRNAFARAMGSARNERLTNVQDLLAQTFAPVGEDEQVLMVITAPADYVLGKDLNSSTALVGATPLTNGQFANLMFALQMGETWGGEGVGFAGLYQMAMPKVIFKDSFLFVPEANLFMAYAELVVTQPGDFAALAKIRGIDVIFTTTNPGFQKPPRSTCLVRIKGRNPDDLWRKFNGLPNSRRLVTWDSLSRVHYGTMPGRLNVPAERQYTLRRWREIFSVISKSTDAAGNDGGDTVLGHSPLGKIEMVKSAENPTYLLLGKSGGGKTSYFLTMLGFARTRNVFHLLVGGTRQSWIEKLYRSFGGASVGFTDDADPKSPEEFQKVAGRLRKQVERQVQLIIDQSRVQGRLVGFPRVLFNNEANIYVYLEYVELWVTVGLQKIAALANELGEEFVVFVDDPVKAVALPRDSRAGGIGNESVLLSERFMDSLKALVSVIRHNNGRLVVSVQSLADVFARFGEPFFSSFSLALVILEHRQALVFEPQMTPATALVEFERAMKDSPKIADEQIKVPGFLFRAFYNLRREILEQMYVPVK